MGILTLECMIGEYGYWTSDTDGVLSPTLKSLKGYYKTTPGSNDECAPTIPAVPVTELDENQFGDHLNKKVSVDHACKFVHTELRLFTKAFCRRDWVALRLFQRDS